MPITGNNGVAPTSKQTIKNPELPARLLASEPASQLAQILQTHISSSGVGATLHLPDPDHLTIYW
eukprot:CAMPEP_0174342612 /NCGR_PEP_ID=MMETSP0810-20121108/26307_1 /TAXON_ID=73025 ORGANISM="Eutreptiella gymnastica-like, Strain CCMP1594" /NCGR_SAMPLE_ID=MMETSP0810 /ASSEMBLY_ACC=CAM_ASM_000659 /LENGTH=64 /DNA_ID=CAMNT_0015464865 /DNA_START=1031 /DNA_END=1222 /DNA_ORIENTATION=-